MNKVIFLLAALLVLPSDSHAFFGLGKYPSKLQAKEACEAWASKGPSEERVFLAFPTEEEKEKLWANVVFKYGRIRERHEDQNIAWGRDGPGTFWKERNTDEQNRILKAYEDDPKTIEFLRVTQEKQTEEFDNIFNRDSLHRVTRNVKIRTCKHEQEAAQHIGIEKDKRKNFRY